MTTSIKSNQNNLNRRLDGTLEPPAFNNSTAEQYAQAWQQERDRIKREREAEKREQKRQEEEENNKSFKDAVKDAVTEKVIEKIEDKVPKGALIIRDVVKWAQDNQLRVQNLLVGLPDDDFNPPIAGNKIPDDSLIPFTPPVPSGFPAGLPDTQAAQWRKMMIPENIGKTFTLKWCYEGWSRPTIINHPITGQTVQLAGDTTLGDVFTSVRSAGGANPPPSNTEIAPFLQGYAFSGQIGKLVRLDSRYTKGWFSDAPIPSQLYSGNDNAYFPSGFTRQNYWGAMKVLSRARFNFPPVAWAEYIRINFRADITVGLESAWDSGWWGTNYPNRLMTQFFECPFQSVINSEVGLVEPEISNNPVVKSPVSPPPPPPPKKRCDCMSCCPQNNSTLEDVKRLIRLVLQKQDETDIEIHRVRVKQGEQSELLGLDKFPYKIDGSPTLYDDIVDVLDSNPLYGMIFKPWLDIAVFNGVVNPKSGKPPIEIANLTEFIAFLNTAKNGEKEIDYIGEPVEMALWDTDPNKPGNQTQKIKPKTVFKAIEAVLNEVTLTQRIIGIDKLPAKVPTKWVTADNTYKMMQAVSKQLGVSAQLEFLKQLVGIGEAQTEITSLVEFLDWQSDQLDDVLGDWEIEVNIADGDLIKAGEQGTTAYVLNMASAMQKTIEASMASNISEKAIINMLTRVLIELQGMKQEIGKSSSQVDCIRDYLGFPTITKVVKVPAHCNFPKPDKNDKDSKAITKVEDLATFLEGTSLDIETEVYEAKGTYQDILVDLQQAAAITRAKDYQRVGSVKDVATLLTGLATAYGLLKPSNDPRKNGGKMPPDSFEAFCEAVENDYSDVPGRVSSTPDAPYGKPRKNRPRIREIGKGKGNADA